MSLRACVQAQARRYARDETPQTSPPSKSQAKGIALGAAQPQKGEDKSSGGWFKSWSWSWSSRSLRSCRAAELRSRKRAVVGSIARQRVRQVDGARCEEFEGPRVEVRCTSRLLDDELETSVAKRASVLGRKERGLATAQPRMQVAGMGNVQFASPLLLLLL